ncbi:DUF4124 domain-containing protein [Undibacterium flavidum]|uniref:DUF4124 domain-containing protein n=1 Tax=Undibacterium flavidum TaxID=2762297 RepID=A0ABR6YHT8_9BURK|nr:DUF4124 domain-containing protein [Undibacterium flavidum]MBC3876004.1 DUF4124 domain-containing protein [Undibacterium flavidum]
MYKNRKLNRKLVVSGLIAALLSSNIAFAQYIWLNEKGVKQYSDTPPPKSVPRDKIIKTPFGNLRGQEKNTAQATDANKSTEVKLEKPVTIASKNEDFNKRKIAREEAEKKADSERQNAENKTKNCERAKSYKQSLDEGLLIMTRDKNGERTPIDEAQRAKEIADVKKVLSECN